MDAQSLCTKSTRCKAQESAGADVYQRIHEGPALSRQRSRRCFWDSLLGEEDVRPRLLESANAREQHGLHQLALHGLEQPGHALLAAAPQGPVVVVAHGGPLRVITGHLLGLPAERWLGLDFACGQVTRLDVESWGVVLKWFNR